MRVNIVDYEVLNPLAEIEKSEIKKASIPEKIKRIVLLDNTKPNADQILDTIRKNLDHIDFYNVKKPAGAPATSNQIKQASKSDITILAVGDCGSCTTWVILDAIRLEKEGTSTISICSDSFTAFAHDLAKAHGIDDLKIVEIEHPIAGQSQKDVENKALKIIPEILTILNGE